MTNFDVDQCRVLEFSADAHARVLGAAGTGKTMLIAHLMRDWLEHGSFSAGQALVLAQGRQHAAKLRDRIEHGVSVTVSGTNVRTATSIAMMICNTHRQHSGDVTVQLMTGTRQDDIIRSALAETAHELSEAFGEEVLEGTPFRTELRDLWRVLDDFGLQPDDLAAYARTVRTDAETSDYLQRLSVRWGAAATVLHRSLHIARERYPHERTASGVLADAVNLLATGCHDAAIAQIPRLVLVDDAAELGEGALALCAALANRGTKFWMFGDPDTSTASFQGEPTRVLTGVHHELARRGATPAALRGTEQVVVLNRVHRHGSQIRGLVQGLSERVGAAGGWQQRSASATREAGSQVEFTTAHTFAEQVGIIAYRLRHRHLGLHDARTRVPWNDMAVICRSADQATQLASALEDLRVPTQAATGGIVLGHHALVRDLLRVLQDGLGLHALEGAEIPQLLLSQLGGLDPIALRRLDHALTLHDRRLALREGREPSTLAEVYLAALDRPETIPDLAEGRAFERLSRVVHAARTVHAAGATPREVLWEAWSASRLSESLIDRATGNVGALSAMAHRNLDAVIELFFAFERHEEQTSDVPITDVITEILTSDVPQDSLAARSSRPAVVVTTPQGASTDEFQVVCIAGPQEGVWPNMRSRGTLVGAHALQTLLRGGSPDPFDRTQTMHEELRLFVSAASRARDELLVVAREDDAEFPSPFFHLGAPYVVDSLPNTTLTLRGYTAKLRRTLLHDPLDEQARDTLAYLASEGVSGASPDEWYGVLPPSTEVPVVDLGDPATVVNVSPSQIETAETCPLNWFVTTYASGPGTVKAQLGTLIHHVLETVHSGSELEMRELVDAHWAQLEFDAPWIEAQARAEAHEMVAGLADYVKDAEASGRAVIAREASFTLTIGQAKLRGIADRIEMVQNEDGSARPMIVDLKTGRTHPTQPEAAENAQLLAYQLGLLETTFSTTTASPEEPQRPHSFQDTAGAALLYVHPKATTTKSRYRMVSQDEMTPETREAFLERVAAAAHVMAADSFEARVEHHCTDPNQFGACSIHIIPAVSYE